MKTGKGLIFSPQKNIFYTKYFTIQFHGTIGIRTEDA